MLIKEEQVTYLPCDSKPNCCSSFTLAAPHLVLFQLQCTLQLRTDNLTARGRAPPQTKRNGNATMHKTDLQLVINPRQNTDLYLMQEDQGAMHSSA